MRARAFLFRGALFLDSGGANPSIKEKICAICGKILMSNKIVWK